MLTLYRRHTKLCPHSTRRQRACKCPIWVQGTLGGHYLRESLDLTSWAAANDLVRQWEALGKRERVVRAPSLREAVKTFLDYQAGRIKEPSLKKYKNILEKYFLTFAGDRSLERVTVELLTEFQTSLKHSALTKQKNIEYLRAFFRFAEHAGWVTSNPAKALKAPPVYGSDKVPFEKAEIERMLETKNPKVKAMVGLLANTGLRISDAIQLKRESVEPNRIVLRTLKTGAKVSVPVPEDVYNSLMEVSGPEYVFWSGNGKPKSCIEDWRRRFLAVYRDADVKKGHFHRFRHYLACRLLSKGTSVENVAAILGNSPAVVLKHYAHWIKARQDALDQAVTETWD